MSESLFQFCKLICERCMLQLSWRSNHFDKIKQSVLNSKYICGCFARYIYFLSEIFLFSLIRHSLVSLNFPASLLFVGGVSGSDASECVQHSAPELQISKNFKRIISGTVEMPPGLNEVGWQHMLVNTLNTTHNLLHRFTAS